MALTFGSLIYIQILYMESMVQMRNNQFDESVKRSLYSTASFLEREETKHYLIEDVGAMESAIFANNYNQPNTLTDTLTVSDSLKFNANPKTEISIEKGQNLKQTYQTLREQIRTQYLYQRGLLNEIILTILRESSNRSVEQRADSTIIREQLVSELENNGIKLPFEFSITNDKGNCMYATEKFNDNDNEIYSQVLFENSNSKLNILVEFPDRSSYIHNSIRFFVPTLTFTLILLIVFIYTVVLVFRQKKLSEMKTDFINNMTHELKTPISTISLASQMLADSSVSKSANMLEHLSSVIGDETKRLRFQVEKVLQMSMFDNKQPNLKFVETNINNTILQVVNTYRLKVEKFGGSITTQTDAKNDIVVVDSMHMTNVLFNLMDNAVKYRDEEREPQLKVHSWNPNNTQLCISISDNGIGIRKDDLKRIFEKFYRVPTGNRHDVKGFGLGLAYVQKMVTEFGGTIHAESEHGKGTIFTITLPLEKSKIQ